MAAETIRFEIIVDDKGTAKVKQFGDELEDSGKEAQKSFGLMSDLRSRTSSS